MPRKQTPEDIAKLHAREQSKAQNPENAVGAPTPPSEAYGTPKTAPPGQQPEADQEQYTEYHEAGYRIEDEELVGDTDSHRDRRR